MNEKSLIAEAAAALSEILLGARDIEEEGKYNGHK